MSFLSCTKFPCSLSPASQLLRKEKEKKSILPVLDLTWCRLLRANDLVAIEQS